jgi:hypothetical protein
MLESTAIAARPLTTRSKITNGTEMLRGIDARTAASRRFRDLCEGFAADFSTPPGAREQALIKQAAAVTVQAEAVQAAIVRGEEIDLEQLTRLTNVQTRTLRELGIRKRGSEPRMPTLREHLAKRAAEGGASTSEGSA